METSWRKEFAGVYSEEDFAKIIRSFKQKDDLTDRFQERLERLVWIYNEGAAENDPLLVLSARKQHLEIDYGQLRRARNAWSRINGNHYLAHQILMAAIAKQVPDLRRPGLISYIGRSFAANRQLSNIRRGLESACEIIKKAIDQVQDEMDPNGGKGGNRPDVPLYQFVRGLWEIYFDFVAEPKKPNGWRASAAECRDEFLDFLAACLEPLEKDPRSPADLYQLYSRACA